MAGDLVRVSFPVGALGCNCTVLVCGATREAIVVDPGDEAPRILAAIAEAGATPVALLHTHAHFDHVMATGEVAAATAAETMVHRDDRLLWDNVPRQAGLFGLPASAPPPPTRELAGSELLRFGRREARVFHTPGHTPGSACFLVERAGEAPLLFSGDTLFAGAVGRTDLWGGSFEQIVRSIRGDLFALPDATVVVPGHGSDTTIGAEREDNPFVGRRARV